jgi:hypothetical protein
MTHRKKSCRGNTVIEFTLVGIPMIFVLISTFEMARGMWLYNTLAAAIKDGARFAIVHGYDCAIPPNSCVVQIRDVANRIAQAGVGLIPAEMHNVTFRTSTRTITCPTLRDCLQGGSLGDTYWPSSAPGARPPDPGGARRMFLEIRGEYPFRSAISMFWPGAGRGMNFGTFMLPASARESIQF